jgi:hypothetical protein
MLRDVPPEQIKGGNVTGELSGLVAFPPHPQIEDLFVGRQAKRSVLAAALFPATGARRPVVVSGTAGVGKSYLVNRFFWESRSRFPQRLSAGGSRRRRAR